MASECSQNEILLRMSYYVESIVEPYHNVRALLLKFFITSHLELKLREASIEVLGIPVYDYFCNT